MAGSSKKVFVVLVEDWSSNGGTTILGVTSRKEWGDSRLGKLGEEEVPSLGYCKTSEFLLDDPKIFPEARKSKKQTARGKI